LRARRLGGVFVRGGVVRCATQRSHERGPRVLQERGLFAAPPRPPRPPRPHLGRVREHVVSFDHRFCFELDDGAHRQCGGGELRLSCSVPGATQALEVREDLEDHLVVRGSAYGLGPHGGAARFKVVGCEFDAHVSFQDDALRRPRGPAVHPGAAERDAPEDARLGIDNACEVIA
jgi:hypothetical protein